MTPTDLSPLRALVTEWYECSDASSVGARIETYRTCAHMLARCLDTLGETEPKGALYPQADRDVQSLVEHVACDFERRGIGECETCDWIRTFLKREIRVPTQARKP